MRKIVSTTSNVPPVATKRVIKGAGLKKATSLQETHPNAKKRKDTIPVKLREEVWIKQMGRAFEGKCPTTWCTNNITVFDFESGHNVPESRGGPTTIENLVPICGRCNRSMGSQHTFEEWCVLYSSASESSPSNPSVLPQDVQAKQGFLSRFFSCHTSSKGK